MPDLPNDTIDRVPESKLRRYLAILRPFLLLFLFLGTIVVLIVLVGFAQRFGWITSGGGGGAADSDAAEIIYYCSMHPHIREKEPGKCPTCDMALVLFTDDRLTPAMRRIAGIETEPVRRMELRRTVRAIGSIRYDEGSIKTIAAYIDGRIERLLADYTGVKVEQGDEMAILYSPELYAAQVELLQAVRMREEAARGRLDRLVDTQTAFAEAARQRLIEMGMTDDQVSAIVESETAQTRMTIHAPRTGTVIEKFVVEGQYVSRGTAIYRIADLSNVWVMLEMFPEDAALVRYGQRVEVEVQSLPGRTFHGRVAFVDPFVDETKRTVGVRVVMLNEQGLLRPGDYATARIHSPAIASQQVYDPDLAGQWISPRHPQIVQSEPGPCPLCGIPLVPATEYGYAAEPIDETLPLVIPRNALLRVGNTSVVFVEVEAGKFETRSIVIGPVTEEHVVVVEGLKLDELVATNGNFLIDSQMQLAGKPSLMDPTQASTSPPGPMDLNVDHVRALEGSDGAQLERLILDYLELQEALAGDKTITSRQSLAIVTTATALRESDQLQDHQRKWLDAIIDEGEHLHQQGINSARRSFRTISHAMLPLVAEVRGEIDAPPLIHYFCPMYMETMGRGGDWFQIAEPLANPYYGNEMLRCGNRVRELLPLPEDANQ